MKSILAWIISFAAGSFGIWKAVNKFSPKIASYESLMRDFLDLLDDIREDAKDGKITADELSKLEAIATKITVDFGIARKS